MSSAAPVFGPAARRPRSFINATDRAALQRVFVYGLVLRLVTAVLLHFFVSEYTFAPDQTAYHAGGAALAQYWSGESLIAPSRLTPPGYFYAVGCLYYVLGISALLPKLANAIIGAYTIRLTYEVALRITNLPKVALRTAMLVAYFPSLILWSALNIRDALVVFFIVVICREALVLQDGFSMRAAVMMAGSVYSLVHFRSYILFPVTLPVVISFFVRNRAHVVRNTALGMLAAAVVIYADQAGGADRKLRTLDLEYLQEMRYWHTVGAASSFEQADISTPSAALAFLPTGLALFLLAPFPWMLGSIRQVLAVPETLFFYWLLPHMFRGLKHLVTHDLASSLMVVLLTTALTLGYALGEGNAGTAYRHRAQMLPFFLFFAAVGLERRRSAATTAPRSFQPAVPLPGLRA
jgi:hypothetical protein